jgi:hypothetical protein
MLITLAYVIKIDKLVESINRLEEKIENLTETKNYF